MAFRSSAVCIGAHCEVALDCACIAGCLIRRPTWQSLYHGTRGLAFSLFANPSSSSPLLLPASLASTAS